MQQQSLINLEKSYISIMNIKLIELLPVNLHEILDDLIQLKNYVNAIYHLEETRAHDKKIKNLLHCCALIMRKISCSMHHPEDRLSLYLRSAYLEEGCTNSCYLTAISTLIEQELLIILSPMITNWIKGKRKKQFSFVAAYPNQNLQSYVDNYFKNTNQIRLFLSEIGTEQKLSLDKIPSCIIADLLLLGGAADNYPKHFSYFMPEDEGKPNSKFKKTTIFSNLISHRFSNTTQIIHYYLIESSQSPFISTEAGLNLLLLWMRGHDIGHFIKLPATNYQALRSIGYFFSMTLQELIADCAGYLFAFPSFGLNPITDLNAESAKGIFLAEMLRYALKDNQELPDSYAAFIELNFLISNEFISIINNKISTTPLQLFNGLKALFQIAIQTILQTNIEKTEQFLAQYGNYEHCDPQLQNFFYYIANNNISFNFGEHIKYLSPQPEIAKNVCQ